MIIFKTEGNYTMSQVKKTGLIIQGGGFRTGYSAGVLDAFIDNHYTSFDLYVGNSGGAIALSYFLSLQRKKCFDAMCYLATERDFMSFFRVISDRGIMDVDYFHEVARNRVPFDVEKAIEHSANAKVAFILTNMHTGKAEYHHPTLYTWLDAVIASCTLPFVTKGKHEISGNQYMDGGWSDPLPVEWAYGEGVREMTVIRTLPPNLKMTQSWPDYFGSIYYRSDDALRNVFENNHLIYNASIDFINEPPKDLTIHQIAPEFPLKAGTYSNSVDAITVDYNFGYQCGMEFLASIGHVRGK